LANEGIRQKVYKVKITQDLRKYTAPARDSKTWKTIFKRRTAVNAYLKEFFQLNNVRYRTGKRAKIHFDMVTLIYNASKLAAVCIFKKSNYKINPNIPIFRLRLITIPLSRQFNLT